MYSKENFIPKIIPKIKSLSQTEKLIFTTYKRNRSITISKLSEEEFIFRQQGYAEKEFKVKEKDLKKVLKKLLKEEFPRSHRIRVYLVPKEENMLNNLKKL